MVDIKALYNDQWSMNKGDTPDKETPNFWSSMAEAFTKKAHNSNARKDAIKFLSEFAWTPNDEVLDIGAGPGTFAIPLAPHVKEITAVDFSSEMLKQLSIQAEKEKVTNIKTICERWLDYTPEKQYDTVLCLNSLGVIASDEEGHSRLLDTLKKLKSTAKKRIIILIPHADSVLNDEMRQILNDNEIPKARFRIPVLHMALIECGMLPNVQIRKRIYEWVFKNKAEAADFLLDKAKVTAPSKEIKTKFEDYVSNRLIKTEDGLYSLSYGTKQALFVCEWDS